MNQTMLALEVPDRMDYPAGFFRWITTVAGQCVWQKFEALALQMARAGRPRYAARSIIEVMRWQTMLHDGTEFKISNNWAPGLARLWMQKHGNEYPRFFRLQDGLGRDIPPPGTGIEVGANDHVELTSPTFTVDGGES